MELYGDVANRVSRRRMEHKAISHRALPVDNFRLPALDHRQNAIFVDSSVDTLLPRRTSPMFIFSPGKQISRIGERRHPAPPAAPARRLDRRQRQPARVQRLPEVPVRATGRGVGASLALAGPISHGPVAWGQQATGPRGSADRLSTFCERADPGPGGRLVSRPPSLASVVKEPATPAVSPSSSTTGDGRRDYRP